MSQSLRSIAYSMDLLIPGLYIWAGKFGLRIGGARVDDEPYRYPGVIHSPVGIALVLPGYRIFSTYSGSMDAAGYRVFWSEEDGEFVGVCDRFPSLSWLAKTEDEAMAGIKSIVSEIAL
jgi:hypothetical protein